MLYTALLYCPCHTETLQIYDEKTRKPCIGLCGHTVCLDCIEKDVHMACPICNQPDVFVHKTPNYASIELIRDCRDNFWQLMKKWWSGENTEHGPCSRCSDQSRALRICLTCDEDNLCTFFNSERRLKMHFDRDLLNLSRHVLCSECAINHHNGHQTMNIDRIKYSKEDIKAATSKIILELFWQEMDNISCTTKCRLRHETIQIIGKRIRMRLRELDYKKGGECGYLGELIRIELITKRIEDIDQKLKELKLFSVGETRCECNRLYDELTKTPTKVKYKGILSQMCDSGIGMFLSGCPLFLTSHLENRLKLYEVIGETPPEQVTPELFNDRQCPLCAFLDHNGHQHLPRNRLEIVENLLTNELPPFSDFCSRCLYHLNQFRVGSSCEDREGWANDTQLYHDPNERRYLNRHLRNNCQKPDCLMKEPKLWKYNIIYVVHIFLAYPWLSGFPHQNFSCQLKKIRLESLNDKAYGELRNIDMRNNSREEFYLILKNVDDAIEVWKNQKTIYEVEIQEPKCECSKLWNKNEIILEKLDKERYAIQEPYLTLKRSLEQMANYSLKEEIPGCPMEFNHGIVVDPIVLKELENMDLEDSLEIVDLDPDTGSVSNPRVY